MKHGMNNGNCAEWVSASGEFCAVHWFYGTKIRCKCGQVRWDKFIKKG